MGESQAMAEASEPTAGTSERELGVDSADPRGRRARPLNGVAESDAISVTPYQLPVGSVRRPIAEHGATGAGDRVESSQQSPNSRCTDG